MQNGYVTRAVEVSIHVGLVVSLVAGCLLILRPFLPLVAWGIIIAIAAYPGHLKLKQLLHERNGLATALSTILLLTALIVPVVLLAGSVIGGLQGLGRRLREGIPIIPPPPDDIANWPIVGRALKEFWELVSTNLPRALQVFAPQIKAIIPDLLVASAGVIIAVIQWIFSILIAGAFLANSTKAATLGRSLGSYFFGDKGKDFEDLACSTVRSVTRGIIGVAFIQSFLAAIGFFAARLPAAGLWAVIYLVTAVLQVGVLVLVPAVIYMFVIASSTKATIFLAWCIVVALIDNVLKPLLLGRGVAVPMIVVFLGAIGGFVAMGTIGLFLGATLLCVGYKLATSSLQSTSARQPEVPEANIGA